MPVKGQSVVNKAQWQPKTSGPPVKPPKKKIIYSNFFITISTNYRAKNEADFHRFNERFAEVLQLMTSEEHIGYFVDFLGPFHQNDTWDAPYIYNYQEETVWSKV